MTFRKADFKTALMLQMMLLGERFRVKTEKLNEFEKLLFAG